MAETILECHFMRARVTLDRAGRIVLPRTVRDELQLAPGDSFDLVVHGDDLTLRPRRTSTPLQKQRGVWVLRTGQPLTAAETDQTLRTIRTVRAQRHGGSVATKHFCSSTISATSSR